MSFCLRSASNRFTSLVNKHRQVIKFNHQLSKQIKSSLFLNEFSDMQTKINVAINSTKCSVNSLICLLGQNIPNTFYNTHIENSNIYKKKYNCNKQETLTVHRWKKLNIQPININNSDLSGMTLTKRISDNTLSSSKTKGILYSETSPNITDINNTQPQEHKSSEERLQTVFNQLQTDLPLLFVRTMNYSIYTADLIFINNIKGTTTTGIYEYIKQISILKIIGHIKFAYVKCNILKMTMHPEDSTIKVRWRIEGISGTSVFLSFWKFSLWNLKNQATEKPAWYDGFSTFYVNNDGKIFKHVVDKLMPDQEQEKVKTPIEPKLALFSALLSLDSYYFDKFDLKTHFHLLQIKQKNE
ncbi:uncharacterized protein LOC100879722 [Megachile rotundata]|uniref:uncharacterized protein LOC100879722 n=1 Tax=Megachile rotundata TaxID=143995 RepID=UPI0006154262|nr:PREDICTED: uncharacterized protein C6orf136 homolog [Megachile rotundata]